MSAAPATEQPTAYVNARLMDPATGRDTPGALLSLNGKIADLGADLFSGGVPDGIPTIDCNGHILAPGLIDMRVHLGEPGEEHKDTIASATAASAAASTTMNNAIWNLMVLTQRARKNAIG